MGTFFSTYDSTDRTDAWSFPQDGGQRLADMPATMGGGQSGPQGQKGGPGAFKRAAQRKAAMAKGVGQIQAISGGKGDMQSFSGLDMALTMSLNGQQPYLARNGGPVQDESAGQRANAAAIANTNNEGGKEADERGTYPFTPSANPHTRDAAEQGWNVGDDGGAPASVPFPYDGDVHAHTDVMAKTSGEWSPGQFPKQTYLDKNGNDTAWTPMQRFAAKLAETVPEAQPYPMSPKLGASLFPQKLS